MSALALRLAFAASLFVATPAAAQFVGSNDYGDVGTSNPFFGDSSLPAPGIGIETRDLRGSIADARSSGLITQREARRLTREVKRIGRAGRYNLSPSQAFALKARVMTIRETLSPARLGAKSEAKSGQR